MNQYTPGLWEKRDKYLVTDKDGRSIAVTWHEADTHRIVTAVNSHNDLLEACEGLIRIYNSDGGMCAHDEAGIIDRAKKAIAKEGAK